MRLTGTGLGGYGLDRHFPHKSLHSFAVNHMALLPEPSAQLPAAIKRVPGIFFIDELHKYQIFSRFRMHPGIPVITGSRQTDQFTLAFHTDL